MKKIILPLILLAFFISGEYSFAQSYSTASVQPEGYTVQQNSPGNGSRDFPGCPGCGIQEGETDIPDSGEDVTNGGCNFSPERYSDIQLGDVVCGRGNGYVDASGISSRDTDWYRFSLSQSTTVYLSGIANFNAVFYLVEYTCPTPTVYAAAVPTPGTVGTATFTLGPGTFIAFVAPNGFGSDPGLDGDYVITVTDHDPGTPDSWCANVPVSNWAIFIGIGLILVFAAFRFRKIV